MKCSNVKQMKAVAKAGAVKMEVSATGYQFKTVKWGGDDVTEITTPKGNVYHADPSIGEGGWCSCPFHEANRHLAPATTCKHLTRLGWIQQAKENRALHAEYRELVQNGGGLGIPTVQAGYGDSRMEKMFAHDADAIEAALV